VTETAFSILPLPAAQLDNLDSLGYRRMTAIQAASLPLAMSGKDLIGQAMTGSGKTAAFALPLLARLNPRDFGTQALVLCPTRELAGQVASEIRRLARYQQNIKVVTLCGGQAIGPQIGSLEHGAHVVVGTPGRIKDHLRKQTLDLRRVNCVVLDEADRMLEMGLSVESLVQDEQIDQQFYICQAEDRLAALVKLLSHYGPEAAVVFCNTKAVVREVSAFLQQQGIAAAELHGDMEQRDRDRVLVQFRHQSCRVLVATDVAARGLDIEDLPAVVNFELPRSAEVYVHRIGRTGRGGKSGLALSLFADNERYRLDSIGKFQQRDLPFEVIQALAGRAKGMLPPAYVTLAVAGGRKDKVRPGDILGALTGEAGIAASAVGKIDVTDQATYVAIATDTADRALGQLINGKIKGRKFKVRKL
jgi:ATP-independent RNA helicase DbpA